MYPKPIERYFAPSSVAETLALRASYPQAVFLAGGQSLLPLMKARRIAAQTLIDINGLRELTDIEVGTDVARVGALVRYRDAVEHPGLRMQANVLVDAALSVGDLQVRNRGTLVGSLCFGDLTGDIAPAAMALGAHVRIMSSTQGPRLVPVSSFKGEGLRRDEIVTHLEFRITQGRPAGAYIKYGRVAQDRAIVSAAVHLVLGASNCIEQAAIVIGGVAPGPMFARSASQELIGRVFGTETHSAVAAAASVEIVTQDDAMASAIYRKQLIFLAVQRALQRSHVTRGGV